MPRHDNQSIVVSPVPLPGLIIPVSYRDEWQDGLGARGWKMDCAIGDPVLIATTAYCGEKVPTSVLIHDILDHFVSGFGLSGHRNEAKATMQLGLRTGAEIASSYAQLVQDIIVSGINGETLEQFLPSARLLERDSADIIKEALTQQLWVYGNQGRVEALSSWQRHGLDYARRSAIGLCLQQLLECAERHVNKHSPAAAQGQFKVGNVVCAIELTTPSKFYLCHKVDSRAHPSPDISALTLRGRSH